MWQQVNRKGTHIPDTLKVPYAEVSPTFFAIMARRAITLLILCCVYYDFCLNGGILIFLFISMKYLFNLLIQIFIEVLFYRGTQPFSKY